MVFDSLSNCKLYYGMHPRFQEAFDFIKKAIAENLEPGKYEIDGKELWASVQEYTSKLEADAKAEQAKAMMEAQRARRKKSAQASATTSTENVLQPPVLEQQPTTEPEPIETAEATEEAFVEPEIVKVVTNEEEKEVNDEPSAPTFVDPMAKIKAEWEREHDIQEALKAGDVDAAINLANKKGS